MLEQSAKTLLRNVVRTVDTHNRIFEEQAMWQMKGRTQRTDWASSSDDNRSRRSAPSSKKWREQDSSTRSPTRRRPRRRSRSSSPHPKHPKNASSLWLRRLAECKEADPDKWHHDGFKELYPELLVDDRKPPIPQELTSTSERSDLRSAHDRSLQHEHQKKRKEKRKRRRRSDKDKCGIDGNISSETDERRNSRWHERRHKKKKKKSHDSDRRQP